MDNNSTELEVLVGVVNKIIFKNPDETFFVFTILDEFDTEVTASGEVIGVQEGLSIEAYGKWIVHKDYGKQFKVEFIKESLPVTKKGIKTYLLSSNIPGIGPKTADLIVNRFGLETFDVIENFSSRLSEVPGLGKKKIEKIREAVKDKKERRDIDIYLGELGISSYLANKIYEEYADNTIHIVKTSPYKLANDIKGIGFVMADKIALSQGIEHNNIHRIVAGILYSLKQLNMEGHTCYPKEKFIEYAANILKVSSAEVYNGLNYAIHSSVVVLSQFSTEDGGVDEFIYSADYFKAETDLVLALDSLLAAPGHKAESIDQISIETTTLDETQLSAINNVALSPISIITGGPGVGKTTVISDIVKRADILELKVAIAAPTGRAAKRASETTSKEASTIHRLLKWDPVKKRFFYGNEEQLPYDLIIIDETSMLDINLALSFFKAVSPGTTIILVGDVDQLPSVGAGKILADFINSKRFPVTHLTKIYRQGDGSHIITNAHSVNSGLMPYAPNNANELSDFYIIEQSDPDKLLELIEKMVLDRIPKRFGYASKEDIQVLTPMNRGRLGTVELNKALQESFNSSNNDFFLVGERKFYKADKVIQTSNNYDKSIFNGDMGYIEEIDDSSSKFWVNFDGNLVEYSFEEAVQITLAYSITIHKSQGSEFPVVILPIISQHYMMLQRNLIYTGMTRAKKLLILIGTRKAISMAVNNSRQRPRYSTLLKRLIKD
jgi:exodeoxyribonuclease V alpha subunit